MISKRLARMAFMQGSGSNYRKLTTEEKKEAEKNFYETLNKTSSTIPKFRNLSMMFKDLIANATIPIPKKIPYQFEIKNDKYTDDYEWMSEEVNNQELTDYLADEFEYTDAVLGSKWLLSKDIFNEIIERTPEYKIQSVHKSGFHYSRDEENIFRQSGEKSEVIINKQEVLDHPILKHDQDFIKFFKENEFVINNFQFSHDHRFIAFCIPTVNSQAIIVKDMAKGMTGFYVEDVDEFFVFDQVYGLFYINRDTLTGKGTECFRADLNPDIEEDEEILNQTRLNVGNVPVVKSELIYKEKDPSFSLEVSSTLSNEYILIKSDNLSYDPYRIAVEFRYRASNKSSGEFLIIQERKEGRNYDVKHQKDFFYLLVSTPEEYNGKVLRLSIPPYSSYSVPPEPLVLPETSEVSTEFLGASAYIPHNENVYIEHLEAYSNHLVEILIDTETSLQYIQVENSSLGTTDIVSYDKYEGQLKVANNKSYRIKMDGGFQDYNDKNFRYVLSTLHSPEQIISYDLDTRTNDVLDYYYTIPGVRLENYTSERIVLPANDGVMIPITLVYHKKNVKTGNNAVGIVQSFGGDIENSHNFKLDYHWYSVLDRGFIWIIPHVRGSNDVNRKWYEQGIQHNKIRHFQDLLDISVSLVAEKIVRGISGYSSNPSGGLALAALIMKEPNLFSATNPILDVFEYIKLKRVITEFGNLDENYESIRSYNPYYQRFPQEFSPVMITADYDHECAFQAIKFLAKTREQKEFASVIYKEYPTWTTEQVKKTDEFTFLIANSKLKK